MQTQPTSPRRIFVDTQGWAEIFHAAGLRHDKATAFLQDARTNQWELITTTLILSELTPLLRSRNFRLPQPDILAIVSQIRGLPNLVIIHVDPVIDREAWELLYAHQQQPWSHVDATSMVVMRQIGVTEVLTADHHFTQAGFLILL